MDNYIRRTQEAMIDGAPTGVFRGDSPPQVSRSWDSFDSAICVAIVVLGALQFVFVRRSSDYLNDTNYFELFKSVLNHASYGFNSVPMTQLPPGFPYLLAALSGMIGTSYIAMLRVVTVSTALALLASYLLLRRQESRGVAAACCLLLGSAHELFLFTTSLVFADMTFFFASMLLLYMTIRLDETERWKSKHTLQWALCGALLVGTVLLKSAGIALLGGLMCWMAVSFFKKQEKAKRRLVLFLPLVIVALVAEGGWLGWAARHQYHEWNVPGYHDNYIAQLRLRSNNDPELGLANWKDVIARPIKSLGDPASAMVGLFTHKDVAPAWYSASTAIPLLLILLGLGYSFREGGGILEWYFVVYEAMILFWPWGFELRFLLPVALLAFLYAWRGGRLLFRAASRWPRVFGAVGLSLAGVGCLCSLRWGRGVMHPRVEYCIALWAAVALISTSVLYLQDPDWGQRFANLLARPVNLRGWAATCWQALAATVVGVVCLTGVVSQVKIGFVNLDTDLSKDDFNYPVIEAAQWIKSNSGPSAVVMARKDDMIYHYSQRRVVWFPPSRNAQLLMDGIRQHQVQYVVVQHGNDTYWAPSAEDCFQAVYQAYPNAFRLAHTGPHNSVYEVLLDPQWHASVAQVTNSTSKIR